MIEELLTLISIYLIVIVNAHLPQIQLSAIYDLYYSLNGDKWTHCQWNLTYLTINNSLPSSYCGLLIDNNTNTTLTSHTITGIYIDGYWNNYPQNLVGTIPDSIENLPDIDTFLISDQPFLSGSIPQTFCNLQYIQQFALWNNGIQFIPNCIATINTLEYFSLYNTPNIYINDSLLSMLCDHANNLYYLELQHLPLFKGSIPQCIGNQLLNLEVFALSSLPLLNSTIPQSFNNFTNLTIFEIRHLQGLHGTLPNNIFTNNPNLNMIFIEVTNLNGLLPIANDCKFNKLTTIAVWYNTLLSWQIPTCIDTWHKLKTFEIGGDTQNVSGTIPKEICNLNNLQTFYMPNALITGTIPHCLFNLSNLMFVGLNNNKLYGAIPPLYSSNIKVVNLYHNALTGSLSDFLILDKYVNLELMTLHENMLYDDDISHSLSKLFVYSTQLQVITLYDNQYIGGNIPTFTQDIYLNQFRVFAAHNLDIGGQLPNNLYFGANVTERAVISLYNNRLCSEIPIDLLQSKNSNNSLVIISGNLFSLKDDIIPNWMDASKFIDAPQLYLSIIDHIGSWIVLIIAIIASLIVINIVKRKLKNNCKQGIGIEIENAFIMEIETMLDFVTDYTFLGLILCLCLLYPLLCKYYSFDVPILSYFCLFFFETKNIYVQLILCILIIIYNILIIRVILRFITLYKPLQNISQQIEMNSYQPMIEQTITNNNNNNMHHNESNRLIKWIRFVWYLYLYGFAIWVLLAYIMSESLPNDNILNIHQNTRKYLSISIYFVMAINNSVLTTNFIHSLLDLSNIAQKHSTTLIMILRTLTSVVIPLFVSYLLLNDCGSLWTHLWNPCLTNEDYLDVSIQVYFKAFEYFDINTSQWLSIDFPSINLQLLTTQQICEHSLRSINFNRCIRSFLYKWCNVLMIKMIIMCIMPIFIMLYKLIMKKMKKLFGKDEEMSIKIDCEYAMITSKLEIIFIFTIFCPLLFPITLVALSSWIVFYRYVIFKLKWNVEFKYIYNATMVNSFPFYFLIFGLIIQQILSSIFVHFGLKNIILSYSLMLIYVIVDFVFLFKIFKK